MFSKFDRDPRSWHRPKYLDLPPAPVLCLRTSLLTMPLLRVLARLRRGPGAPPTHVPGAACHVRIFYFLSFTRKNLPTPSAPSAPISTTLARNPIPIIRPAGCAPQLPGPGCEVNDCTPSAPQVRSLPMFGFIHSRARTRPVLSAGFHADFQPKFGAHQSPCPRSSSA